MVFELALFFLIVFLFFVLSMVWPPDSPWAPWWRTSKKTAIKMCHLAKVNKNDIVFDLGSGDGESLIVASNEFGARGVGIEIDPLRFIVSKLRIKFSGLSNKIKIKKANFFDEDLSKATVVFVYLVPKTLKKLKPKFLKELKSGTRIVSFRYNMDFPLKNEDKNFKLYLYKIT